MRRIFLAISASLCLCLIACYDVNEEITISENGSGHYATRIDMSGLLEMIQQFSSDSNVSKGLERSIDTTIAFRSTIDSTKNLSAEQKAIMETGVMHMLMDLKSKKFVIDLGFDFKNNRELEILLSGAGTGSLSDAMTNVLGKQPAAENQLDAPKDLEVDQLNNIYTIKVDKGQISKKIDKSKLDAVLNRPEMEQLNQMGGTGMEILYTTTIVLPRPLQNTTNSNIKVSADRKRLTIRNNLMDIFVKPEQFEFDIRF